MDQLKVQAILIGSRQIPSKQLGVVMTLPHFIGVSSEAVAQLLRQSRNV